MASDDFDIVIEAMLEAPYKKEEDEQQRKEVKKDYPSNTTSSTSNSGNSGTSGSSTIGETSNRSRDRDRYRRRNSRSRSRDRQRRHRSRSWDRRHSSELRSRDRRHEDRVSYRSPPLAAGYRYGHSKSPHFREKSPVREPVDNLSPEERDARTVFCMQLAARIRPRDLEDFFSAVGKVRDVRIISDRNSRRSKGIAYVEFCEIQSVPLAIGLTGQRLLGVPIIVQASQAEKNRLAAMANNLQKGSGGPMRLYVGSLHFNITEDMLRGIFEPFGKIDNIVLMKDSDTGRSKGYGFITFSDSECARRALEQLNGFELAGRPMRVGHVTERLDGGTDITFPDGDQELDPGSAGGRLQLMAKLAEGSGIQLPTTAAAAAAAAAAAHAAALQLNGAVPLGALNPAALTALSPALNLASQCFQLSSLFTPQTM
ncbi:probable RNA-binding protein 23 isoform X4 [Macaca thibetana thibetana]|uniref:RNA binding motif protein 23 n=1 Tax=Macaca fascicularis TaxID=9541 RepID=A0A2K5U3E8_MACFA|nr:PREDICTED: probable RNA-binding protein 23 isoform X4 [Macaca fascicularis]XP_015309058.1 PREDICTED: probable RNA-binding protein 23 isoform X3 [Macaca fascicularis]XP_050652491.1 probable RNA-binding protein 23 isoform X3 [Macaca thibetana thibetana]XP_050652492.1 probable RNA-binding protein 23 isoform X4 [Macaca thibetana thibetana]